MADKVKAVRIMCDFCADGVWNAPSVPNSSMDGFRVSDPLWQRIQDWQRWHDTQNPLKSPDPAFDLRGFVAEGYAIARAVKAELPDWVVIYSDEALLTQSIETGDQSIEWLIEIT
ncbi:MAG: hypothetical protein AABZ73_06755 [Pseudomonadota bacterium]|uniref:hypothetical protein n=1 Tax=Sphingobium sp. TaxID=1912891 RepID=UPI002E1F24B8